MTDNPLVQLNKLGQSVWYDNVRRSLIAGDLARMIAAGEITGLTSNPTIFEKAIGGSADYDASIEPLARAGASVEQIFESLAVEDIRAVADLLRPIYDRSKGQDGYASFEVSPLLANDTAGSVAAARRLFDLIGRENVMIKIPGTPAGLPAFEQATADGINVNVTLLFSVENYEQVARAYISGLERRLAAGKPINKVGSVASFFVSRVDTAVDSALEARVKAGATELRDLQGTAAIANAKLAYQRFKEIFAEPRFAKLAGNGAMVQRPLWGSTGTKNPSYSDVLYVDELIGERSVNTMPPATIDAFRDHGKVALTVERDLDRARQNLERLAAAGIDLDAITDKLQVDGVAAFADSFKQLMDAVESKSRALATSPAPAR